MVTELRPSPLAGTWYSGNPERLQADVDAFLAQAELPDLDGEVVGVMAPHAGYRYSGYTTGYAFKAVMGLQPDLVAVISPLHAYRPEPFLTTAHAGYQTPLGPVWVDQGAVQKLNAYLEAHIGVGLTFIEQDNEHSLEIELPFLQQALASDFKLLPVMVRAQSPELGQMLGNGLAEVLKSKQSLLVASTDLSHFYPEQVADQLDQTMLERVADFDPEGMFSTQDAGEGFACGLGAVAAVLWAARDLGANDVQILHHSTSGDATGDHQSVVGYGAAAILKSA
ncbi:MAG: AmmeMemoRadiSam system protein B [Anaerolineales bacterium]|nr:AmmeMemoRadiSam system protein B [Anaerolineales bacterium]